MTVDSRSFAEEWVEAWNARDLERILSHYAADIVFLSPVAARRLGDGRVSGIAALGEYWSAALEAIPDLRFTLEAALSGHQCLTNPLPQSARTTGCRDGRVQRGRKDLPFFRLLWRAARLIAEPDGGRRGNRLA